VVKTERASRKLIYCSAYCRERLALFLAAICTPESCFVTTVGMLESDYIHAASPKLPVRVSRRSQLTAALRQHARPIVIEDQELARPFARLLRARQLRLWALGEFVSDTMPYAIGRSYGANIEAHWYIARYVLPGNVQKVILKPKQFGFNAPTAADAGY
ncbi:MAG: hypothetical protein WBW14_16625, partial [Candidatus Acidiferrum sp.]